MPREINLDEVAEPLVFVLGGKKYPLIDMTAESSLSWNELRRKRDRAERRLKEQQDKMNAPDVNDEQMDVFSAQIKELDSLIAHYDAQTMVLVLDGITVEDAMKLSTLHRAKIMSEVTKNMNQAMAEMKEQLPKGEAPTP